MAEGLKTDNPEITGCLILEAKQNKDFSACVLPDGATPTNWGQFKRAALGKDKKNLGIIVSGHVQTLDETTTTNSLDKHGNGKDKHQNKGNGQGNKP